MSIIGKVRGEATVYLNRTDINKLLNKHHLGQENCNKPVKGKLVPIEHPNMEALKEASKNVCENIVFVVEGDLTSDGKIINLRVV